MLRVVTAILKNLSKNLCCPEESCLFQKLSLKDYSNVFEIIIIIIIIIIIVILFFKFLLLLF